MRYATTRGLHLAAALLFAATLGCGAAPPPAIEQLGNLRLSPDYSHWLVGPVVLVSTRAEVEAFMALTDDAAAAAFIEDFWARRGEAVRRTFDTRAAEADLRFAEAGFIGRRTDRGTIYVLHGAPDAIRFENTEFRSEPPIEVWSYEPGSIGLNGKPPSPTYRFAKLGERTVFYQQRVRRRGEAEVIR